MVTEIRKKVKIYCSKCGDFIGEVELFGELPEAFKNHVFCRKHLLEEN